MAKLYIIYKILKFTINLEYVYLVRKKITI
jgi:hypothetical protein